MNKEGDKKCKKCGNSCFGRHCRSCYEKKGTYRVHHMRKNFKEYNPLYNDNLTVKRYGIY